MSYSMYLIGIVVAIVVSAVIHLLDQKKSVNDLMIELPEYKLPDAHTVAIYVWEKIKDYLGYLYRLSNRFIDYLKQERKQHDRSFVGDGADS